MPDFTSPWAGSTTDERKQSAWQLLQDRGRLGGTVGAEFVPRSPFGEDFTGAFDIDMGAWEDAVGRQDESREYIDNFKPISAFENPIVQRTLAMLDPQGSIARRARGQFRSDAASNLRSQQSKIGGALGQRGVTGGTEAALRAKATQSALAERIGGENALDKILMSLQTPFVSSLATSDAGIRSALDTAKIGARSREETLLPPSAMDAFMDDESMELFREQLEQWTTGQEESETDIFDMLQNPQGYGVSDWLRQLTEQFGDFFAAPQFRR